MNHEFLGLKSMQSKAMTVGKSSTYQPAFSRFTAFLAGLFLLVSLNPLSAQQVNGAGSTSTNFLKIGQGARAVGMGEAFTGVSDDATAIFWNPAGLVLARGTQFNLTHGEWLQGVSTEFFSFSQNLERDGAFGGSINYLGTGSFQGALENPDGTYGGPGDMISATNYSGTVAYAQRLGNWIGGDFFKHSFLGLEATVTGQNVVNVGSAGLAFNLGYMYEIQRKTFYVGAVLNDLGTSIQDFTQPLNYIFAGSYWLHNALMKRDRYIISLETHGYIDTGLSVNVGDEYQMTFGRNDVALRVGYRTAADSGGTDGGLTAGVGVAHRFDDFQEGIDYAFVPYGILGATHRVSVNMVIGGVLTKPEAYVNGSPAFILGQQSSAINFSTRSEEPIDSWKVKILDPSGMLVKSIEGKGNPPSHSVWDGKNQTGVLVPDGNYTYNLEVTDDNEMTGKSRPWTVAAKWVPKKVPYQYTFEVPGDLLFDSGRDALQPRGYEAIQKAVAAIKQRYPQSLIIVAGHTDDQKLAKSARFKDNQALSLARAQAVMDYLVRSGMDGKKLSVMGYGETKPIADNKTKEGRAKNRRVELVVSGVMEAGPEVLIEEGQTMLKANRTREALTRFLKAIEADSRNSKAYHLAGDCYLLLGGKDQAAQAYRKALELNPKDTALKTWLDQYAPAPKPVLPPAGATPVPAGPAASTQPPSTAPANN